MPDGLQITKEALEQYRSQAGARAFFETLGYPTMDPLPWEPADLPQGARKTVRSVHQIVHLGDGSPFRIFHVELNCGAIRRSDVRRFLEAFYRHYPQGENLFVFSPGCTGGQDACPYEELAFVSPRRLPALRGSSPVRLWLRILQVQRERPYRTDLEVLDRIRADGTRNPEEIWQRHEEAFSVQRVTEQFFQDYRRVFTRLQEHLEKSHPQNDRKWARDTTHQLLNRIMFLYFIARKGWLLGPEGKPDRDFMRHFWEAYRQAGTQDAFHRDWLDVLFFEAFNGRFQNREDYRRRFPKWVLDALAQAPFLNGGLYTRRPGLDDRLERPFPDEAFALLFEQWTDGTCPGLFERYNFTVVESGHLDEEVAVDPEMLGAVYERLVNVTFESEEDLRGTAGIFYTPRTEIDLMCRLALVDWLGNRLKSKDLLYRWVFALSEEEKQEADQAVTQEGLWEDLDKFVRRVRVCDPACGSGSFLVGMMLVLDDLQARCNRALGRSETPYERRKRILQDQLYGVDVMEWAVRVAELRLWLQLVVETELHPAELRFRPLLPNLSFKLRPGDSLLQTLGDLDLSPFRRSELPVSASLKGRLIQLLGRKRRFFQGEEPDLTEEALHREERALFRDLLGDRIHTLQNTLAQRRSRLQGLEAQGALPGMDAPQGAGIQPDNHRRRLEEEIQEIEEQLERFRQARKAIGPEASLPFVWDMAFAEVFEGDDPGFDLVIGNPPYVRQEKIRDYLGRFERAEYLGRLNESLRAIYPGFMGRARKISGRADYYLYFYLHALSLLANRGSFCFITSNSWLDVDFGRDLQEFFLRFGHLKMVLDNRARRSFAQADVNTVIVLAGPPERKRPLDEEEMQGRLVRFVAFQVPFEEALGPVVFEEIEDESLYQPLAGFRVLRRPEFRAILHDQGSLYREGLAEPEEEAEGQGRRARQMAAVERRPYAGNKWGGKYLRAPDIFFTILEKGKGKLVRLGDIAEVRRGFTTGANEFFYLEPVGRTVKEVAELREKDPMGPVRVRNGAGWEGEIEAGWLRPVIKSPREIRTLRVRLEDLRYLVFMPPEEVREAIEQGRKPPLARYPKAAAYIRWGEKQGYPRRSTCASRRWWWDLGTGINDEVIFPERHQQRFFIAHNPSRVCLNKSFYGIKGDEMIAAILASVFAHLTAEMIGRTPGGGGGPLDLDVIMAENTLICNPFLLDSQQQRSLVQTFRQTSYREIKGALEELGFPLCRERRCAHPEHPYEQVRPEALTLEQVRKASPDRFELDRVVFDVLGLTDEERLAVYRAVAQLVKDRLVKARSV